MNQSQSSHPVCQLLTPRPRTALLGQWLGDPMPVEFAQELIDSTRLKIREALRGGEDVFNLEATVAVARFWLTPKPGAEHLFLPLTPQSSDQAALRLLLEGQLLMSRKLRPAIARLDDGFRQGAKSMSAADYLAVMNRHNRLRNLVLGPEPSPPATLTELLAEAAVIEKLEKSQPQGRRKGLSSDRSDTVG